MLSAAWLVALVFHSPDVALDKSLYLDWVDFSRFIVAHFGNGLPEDVLVLLLRDLPMIVVRLEGQLHFLYHTLLAIQLLQELLLDLHLHSRTGQLIQNLKLALVHSHGGLGVDLQG
uniref:Putative secreted protein n=1 Tax=Ixodes ricinus TaxID=34613 RepID=A0A6B0ULF1_IXORI